MTTLLAPMSEPMTSKYTRQEDRHYLPDGLFAIEPSRAVVAFTGRTSRFLPAVSARFREVEGSIVIDAASGIVDIDVAIALASVTSGNRAWDEMIAIADPFDVRRQPVARYTGRAGGCGTFGTAAGVDALAIVGELSMRGRQRPVPLTATWQRTTTGRLTVQAGGIVDRAAFGLRFDIPALSRLLPQRMNLTIDLEAGRDSQC